MPILPHYDKDCPENIYQADWFKIKEYVVNHLDIHRESGVHYRPGELDKIVRKIVDEQISINEEQERRDDGLCSSRKEEVQFWQGKN